VKVDKDIESVCEKCSNESDEETFIKLLATLKPEVLHTALIILETAHHCICEKIHPRIYWLGAVQNYKVASMMKKCKSLNVGAHQDTSENTGEKSK
jgi:hypothetical protein